MKKLLIVLMMPALILWVASTAMAIPVDFSYTADNEITSWTIGGSGQSLGVNWNDWGNADTATFDLSPGTYDIIWEVNNWIGEHNGVNYSSDPMHNPAGLLAEISFGGMNLLSSGTWQTSADGFSWEDAVMYGANNDSSTPWYVSTYHQGLIDGISEDAQWIWDDGNMDGHLFIKATVDVPAAHAPEPATLFLLGSGLIGLAGLKKLKKGNIKS